ncbi:MAG: hypothetical protein A3H27_11335 [Acidobacteria bacterium RIFCSPLOWO2_02_FULL_59_13]|nr:MAG: hypothetical protein A3H27_11335 [Acidobacteria bacterium RIFCSPLOWO2_02_FULL_59_13]
MSLKFPSALSEPPEFADKNLLRSPNGRVDTGKELSYSSSAVTDISKFGVMEVNSGNRAR